VGKYFGYSLYFRLTISSLALLNISPVISNEMMPLTLTDVSFDTMYSVVPYLKQIIYSN
jgi:hypothetical protein